jgi:hypothetical protein
MRSPNAVIRRTKEFPDVSSLVSASGSTPRLSHTVVMVPRAAGFARPQPQRGLETRWQSPRPHVAASPALNCEIKSAKTQESKVKARVRQKLTLSMGLSAHNLITQLAMRLLDHSKSLSLVMDGHPQRLDLSSGARESLVPFSDDPL